MPDPLESLRLPPSARGPAGPSSPPRLRGRMRGRPRPLAARSQPVHDPPGDHHVHHRDRDRPGRHALPLRGTTRGRRSTSTGTSSAPSRRCGCVGDDGRIGHAEFTIGGARFMLADEFPEIGVLSPAHPRQHAGGPPPGGGRRRPRPQPGGRRRRRRACGRPSDQTHGNRNATILDPFGHRWMLSQPIEQLSTEEYAARRGRRPATGRSRASRGARRARLPHLPDRGPRQGEGLLRRAVRLGDRGGQHGRRATATSATPGSRWASCPPARASPSPSTSGSTTSSPTPTQIEALGGRVLSRSDYASGGNAECEDDQGFRFAPPPARPGLLTEAGAFTDSARLRSRQAEQPRRLAGSAAPVGRSPTSVTAAR